MRRIHLQVPSIAAWTLATVCGVLALGWSLPAAAAPPPERTIEIELQGQRVEGMPLFWSAGTVELLGRDGRLWSFSPERARGARQVSSSFRSFPASVMKQRLQAELGPSFHIVGTNHYLVALPVGVRSSWAERFEELYRSFAMYFQVRGFQLREPQFPLVAIVWPNQHSFQRAAQAEGAGVSASVLGYYSPVTNRIMLFDVGGGNGGAASLQETAATIIHEATHQTAFNTGLHQRFGETPKWVIEGLGTMFEAPGVWNSRAHRNRADRINRGRLDYFRENLAAGRNGELLRSLATNDRMFDADPAGAYAAAWALTFYLVETQPRQYAQYLALTARRAPFEAYPETAKVTDFASVFGSDFRMLEARFLRFMSELR